MHWFERFCLFVFIKAATMFRFQLLQQDCLHMVHSSEVVCRILGVAILLTTFPHFKTFGPEYIVSLVDDFT